MAEVFIVVSEDLGGSHIEGVYTRLDAAELAVMQIKKLKDTDIVEIEKWILDYPARRGGSSTIRSERVR